MKSVSFYPLIAVLASLLWAYFSFRYYVYYRGLIHPGVDDKDKNRRLLSWARVFLLVSSLALVGLLVNLFNLPGGANPPLTTATSTPGEEVGQLSPTPGLTPLLVLTSTIVSTSTPEVLPVAGFARVGNTNTFGVNVRSEPGLKYEMLAQLSDGTRVELTGEAQIADGFNWQRVRLADGRLGWIADNFLIPEL